MVGIEDGLRALELDDLLGPFCPGQGHEPVHIGARHRVLGGRDRHLREAIQLAKRLLLDRLRHAHRFNLLAQLLDLFGLLVPFAQLLLNRLELLAQEVLPLVLADLRLHLGLNLRTQLEDLQLLDQDAVEQVHARANVERLEDLLPRASRQRREARRDEIGELGRIDDVQREGLKVVRQQRGQRDDLLKVRLDVPLQRVNLQPVLVAKLFVGRRDVGADVRLQRDDAYRAAAARVPGR